MTNCASITSDAAPKTRPLERKAKPNRNGDPSWLPQAMWYCTAVGGNLRGGDLALVELVGVLLRRGVSCIALVVQELVGSHTQPQSKNMRVDGSGVALWHLKPFLCGLCLIHLFAGCFPFFLVGDVRLSLCLLLFLLNCRVDLHGWAGTGGSHALCLAFARWHLE